MSSLIALVVLMYRGEEVWGNESRKLKHSRSESRSRDISHHHRSLPQIGYNRPGAGELQRAHPYTTLA